MKEETMARLLLSLYQKYSNALIENEKSGGAKYTDEDFDSLSQFMKFIALNHD